MAVTLSTTALCGLDLVKTMLEIPDTSSDDYLTTLINHLSVEVEKYCDRVFSEETLTEYHDGDNTRTLYTRQFPIISITTIHNDPNIPPTFEAGTLEDSVYYGIKTDTNGCIYFRDSVLYVGTENIKVVYVAGYDRGTGPGEIDDTLPEDLQYAVARHIARTFKEKGGRSLGHEQLKSKAGDTTYLKTMEPMDKAVFDRYRLMDPT